MWTDVNTAGSLSIRFYAVKLARPEPEDETRPFTADPVNNGRILPGAQGWSGHFIQTPSCLFPTPYKVYFILPQWEQGR